MNRILITGAAGNIGKTLREGLRGRYPVLRLSDIAPMDAGGPGEEIAPADLTNFGEVEAAMQGVDCVVHLGGISVEDTWEKILPNSIAGTWNVFEAARRHGCLRVVYASSHHAVGYYRRGRFIDATVPPRPDGPYGVSKVFGEAVGRMFADKHGMTVACLRIGAFQQRPIRRQATVMPCLSAYRCTCG
jgi:uronate dehydrogenase